MTRSKGKNSIVSRFRLVRYAGRVGFADSSLSLSLSLSRIATLFSLSLLLVFGTLISPFSTKTAQAADFSQTYTTLQTVSIPNDAINIVVGVAGAGGGSGSVGNTGLGSGTATSGAGGRGGLVTKTFAVGGFDVVISQIGGAGAGGSPHPSYGGTGGNTIAVANGETLQGNGGSGGACRINATVGGSPCPVGSGSGAAGAGGGGSGGNVTIGGGATGGSGVSCSASGFDVCSRVGNAGSAGYVTIAYDIAQPPTLTGTANSDVSAPSGTRPYVLVGGESDKHIPFLSVFGTQFMTPMELEFSNQTDPSKVYKILVNNGNVSGDTTGYRDYGCMIQSTSKIYCGGGAGEYSMAEGVYSVTATTAAGVSAAWADAFEVVKVDYTPNWAFADTVGSVTFSGEFVANDYAAMYLDYIKNCDALESFTQVTCSHIALAAGVYDVEFHSSGIGVVYFIDGFTVAEPFVELSVDKSSLAMSGLPNVLIADYLTATVRTNNPSGYHLDIEATEPRLTCSSYDTNYYIEPLGSAETGAMLDNKWGYAVGTAGVDSPPSVWTGVTTSPVLFDGYGSATNPILGRNTRLWFGTKVNYSLPACEYGGSVTITVIANEL
jgi:hypothetical protein